MPRSKLARKFPPSKPCSCRICVSYCQRPGWWTVSQAAYVITAGYGHRMMLELSPDLTFGVLSPAFKGNEGGIAVQDFAENGCTFLRNERCELFNSNFQPLECRFCHHSRVGQGIACHAAIEKDWFTQAGQQLVTLWCEETKINRKYDLALPFIFDLHNSEVTFINL